MMMVTIMSGKLLWDRDALTHIRWCPINKYRREELQTLQSCGVVWCWTYSPVAFCAKGRLIVGACGAR